MQTEHGNQLYDFSLSFWLLSFLSIERFLRFLGRFLALQRTSRGAVLSLLAETQTLAVPSAARVPPARWRTDRDKKEKQKAEGKHQGILQEKRHTWSVSSAPGGAVVRGHCRFSSGGAAVAEVTTRAARNILRSFHTVSFLRVW